MFSETWYSSPNLRKKWEAVVLDMDGTHDRSVQVPDSAALGPDAGGLSELDRRLLAEADQLYISSYTHTVDAKGRMVVPQVFRQMLGSSFYIAPSYDFTAVGLYTKLEWARTRYRYASVDPLDGDVREWVEFFNAYSYGNQECDGQGRVLLPTNLREALLGDEKELIVSGADNYVRITGAKANAERFKQFRGRAPEIMSNMSRLQAMRRGS